MTPVRLPRVLQLFNSFNHGGTERQTLQLARMLREDGRYEVFIACQNGAGVLREEAERIASGPVASYPLRCLYDANALRQVRRFAAQLRALEIDVLHTHDFYTNTFGLLAGALAGTPVRVAARREMAVTTPWKKRVECRLFGLAHAVVANCEAIRRQLIAEGVAADRVVTVHNGVVLDRVPPYPAPSEESSAAALGLPNRGLGRLVTMVANLRHGLKDHPTLLRTARRVLESCPDALFALAGEGELMVPLRQLAARLGVTERVRFLGRCDQVPELLRLSNVCVLTSLSEGFPNVVLEYMAAARPVVATTVGGVDEIVVHGTTGYLARPGDDAALAEHVVDLLRHPDRARWMGERGRARVERSFSAAAQFDRTQRLYRELLHARRPGSGADCLVATTIAGAADGREDGTRA